MSRGIARLRPQAGERALGLDHLRVLVPPAVERRPLRRARRGGTPPPGAAAPCRAARNARAPSGPVKGAKRRRGRDRAALAPREAEAREHVDERQHDRGRQAGAPGDLVRRGGAVEVVEEAGLARRPRVRSRSRSPRRARRAGAGPRRAAAAAPATAASGAGAARSGRPRATGGRRRARASPQRIVTVTAVDGSRTVTRAPWKLGMPRRPTSFEKP